MKQAQQRATLIVVLILLVVITVLGTLAIRQSMVTLNIATNSQAMQLMLQNADSAFLMLKNKAILFKHLVVAVCLVILMEQLIKIRSWCFVIAVQIKKVF
jgi:nitrate reductase gamma subunit